MSLMALGAAGMALSGVASLGNLGMGIMDYNYRKNLQQEIFSREDSSIQRRVADLKAAGLSPVLAAGQGASAGAVVSTEAPQYKGNPLQDAMQLMQMKQNIEQTEAQKAYLAMQAQGKSIENAISSMDLKKYIETGVNPRSGTSIAKQFQDLYSVIGSPIGQQVKKDLQSKIQFHGDLVKQIPKTEVKGEIKKIGPEPQWLINLRNKIKGGE